jgi:hypothetical protein
VRRINKVLFAFACILVVLSLWVSIRISYAAPAFEELLHNFGAEIGNRTERVLRYHYLGLIAPIIVFPVTLGRYFHATDAPIMKMEAK